MVSCSESHVLLRHGKAEKGETYGLVQSTFFSRVYYILSARGAGRKRVSKKTLVLHDFGRGSQHQEFSISTMADVASFQHETSSTLDRNATSEQSHGVVVVNAFSHAHDLSLSR